MKKLLLGSAAFLLLSAGVASATDMPMKAPVYKAAAPFSWSGFYAGAHVGYGWGEYEVFDNISIVPDQSFNLDTRGWFGGAQVGYNSHFAPNWLIGAEIDISGGDISRSGLEAPGGGPAQAKVDYFGTARTRLGYVMDRTLVYVTGGLAWTHDKYNYSIPGPLFIANDKQFHVGWTIGGGIEYALDTRWSLKLEYLYADFEKNVITAPSVPTTQRTADLTLSTVKFGVNYRFGDPGILPSYMPVKAAAPRSPWNGSYLGLHGGYGWSDLDITEGYIAPVQTASLAPKGWFGGFQSGYNWHFAPMWLAGIEIDSSFGNLKDSGITQPALFGASTKIDQFGSGRLRLGYIMDRTLVYVTGGVAYGRENKTTINFLTDTTKVYHVGPAVGGGVEYKFDPNWSLKVEYLYADLGKFEDARPFAPQGRVTDLNLSTIKVGVNYSGPIIERFFGAR